MGVLIGDLMAMAETQEWRARDAAWWRSLTNKRRGEMAEAAFLHKASSLGFGVSKPWGDSEPYDLIVDSGSGLWRIQVSRPIEPIKRADTRLTRMAVSPRRP